MNKLHFDVETFSELDLKKVGGHKYAMHPSTEVMMASYAMSQGDVGLWVPAEGEPTPSSLHEYLLAAAADHPDTLIAAFNAQFERLILKYVLGYDIPARRFDCVMVHAWHLGFSGGLAQVGHQLGVGDDKKKLATGKKLINKFCSPAPKNHKAKRYTHLNAPEDWAEFKIYCIGDTTSEREVDHLLIGYPMPQQERDLWCLDQEINDRGVPIDLGLVQGACHIEKAEKSHLKAQLGEMTGLANGNSVAQLKPWLEARGLPLPDMTKATLEATLKRADLHPGLRAVVETKLNAGKTSTTKWHAFARACGPDGWLRGMFAFGGAQRTQRWAGRIVQLHNLKSPRMKNPDVLADMLIPGDRTVVQALHGDVIGLLSETVRCAITAPEGTRIAVSDLSSIESRYLGWMAGCVRINEIFASGKDTYKDFAAERFKCSYEEVTSDQRKWSKPPVLGCGYQLGGKGLVEYAEGMGTIMSLDDAQEAVDLWRSLYPEVPAMWYWLLDCCKKVTEAAPGLVFAGYTVRIYRDQNFLFIELPSGRRIAYYQPLVQMRIPPWEKEKAEEALKQLDDDIAAGLIPAHERGILAKEIYDDQKPRPTLTYMGMNQYINKWVRITTHGGKITENIVQAGSRDVLAFDMVEANTQPEFEIIGHVHDEILTLVHWMGAHQSLEKLEGIMSVTPPWAPGLLLAADGFVTIRYKKEG